MKNYQLEENENYFQKVISILPENGKYIYPLIQEVFTKKEGKLTCSDKAYNSVKEIVRLDFLTKNFKVVNQ